MFDQQDILSQEVGEAANPNPELVKWEILHIKCIPLLLEEDKLLWFKGTLCFHIHTHCLLCVITYSLTKHQTLFTPFLCF